MIFYISLLAHLLYDFHWQGDFIAQNKGKHILFLSVHALTWALLKGAVLWWFGLPLLFLRVAFLYITHLCIDSWKCQLPKTPEYFWGIYVDQGLHLTTILLVCFV